MKNKGITLVALVITIIVLLLLAGVTISLVLGDKGILTNAKEAKVETRGASVEEQVGLWKLGNKTAKIQGGMGESLESILKRLQEEKQLTEDEVKTINKASNIKKEITIGSKTISFLDENAGTGEPTPPVETTIADGSWSSDKAVNKPKVITSTGNSGLIPVTIANDGTPTEKATDNTDWYSYDESNRQWGNAITKNSTGETTGYFVWIPRYAYKITYTNTSNKSSGGTIDVVFLKDKTTQDKDGKDVTDSNYTDSKGNTGAYIVHPAFQDGKSKGYPNGEWREEVEGIWVAKFEAGFAGGNNSVTPQDSDITYSEAVANYYGGVTAGSTQIKYPVFLPTTYAVNRINISDIYGICKEMKTEGNPYQFANKIDTHQMKNSEWGVVAYLAHSKYGRNGEEVTINNVYGGGTNNTYGMTGYAGASVSAAQVNGTGSSYAWNTTNGYKASTTDNIYGIYDLSGGLYEYTAGYTNNAAGAGSLNTYGSRIYTEGGTNTSTEYKFVYQASSSDNNQANYLQSPNPNRKGEAIWETSTQGEGYTSWFSDCSYFPYSSGPCSVRGGCSRDTTGAGLFYLADTCGTTYGNYGFRAVAVCE